MPHRRRARRTSRRIRIRWVRVAGLLAAIAATIVVLGHQSPASTSSSSSSSSPPAIAPPRAEVVHRQRPQRPLGVADGAVPDGTTVFDDAIPGVAKLDPDLLVALRQSANDAANVGVQLYLDSGWRSAEYQEHLLQEAISEYGSEAEAARWVATPDTSAHVSGDAVDIGPSAAAAWLSEHGAAYGLCRIYGNEPWHYELRHDGCPPMYADPTDDPRMQQ